MKKEKLFLILFFLGYLFFNIKLLSDYGMGWDEQVHYQRGQVYLQYFLTGNGNSFNLSSRQSIYKDFKLGTSWRDFSFFIKNDSGHPPLNGIFSAITNRIFFEKLGILEDIEAYHLFIVLTSVFLSALVFYWIKSEYGLFAGMASFLSLALYPLFFGESHFNIKDPVETSFYTATLYFFYKGITRNSWRQIIISSVFAGLALSTKFNIFFLPFTVLPWLIIYKWRELKSFKWPFSFSISKALFIYLFISFGILFISWPYLWGNPLANFMKIIGYYKSVGYGITYQPSTYIIFGGFNTFALQWILYTTPIIILFFSILGVLYCSRYGLREKNKLSLLILLWLIVSIFRVTFPKTGIMGGVREIMEYIPAMAILAGIGAKYMVTWLHGYIVKYKPFSHLTIKPFQLLVILFFIPITLKLISIHPNENVYFNPLIGGLKGAREKNVMYWGYNLGNVFRQSTLWLNQNAGENSQVTRGTAYEDIIPAFWFRKDIKYSHDYQSGFEKKGEYIIEFTHNMPAWPHYYYYNYARNILKPSYEIKVDDVPILTIWKNDWEHTKEEFKKKEEEIKISNIKKEKNYILIDTGREILLTQVEIIFASPDCKFTSDGYFVTSDDRGEWTNHPGNLGEIEFYKNFNPRKNKDSLSYLFPGEKTRLIKVIFSEDNNCFENIKGVNVKRIP